MQRSPATNKAEEANNEPIIYTQPVLSLSAPQTGELLRPPPLLPRSMATTWATTETTPTPSIPACSSAPASTQTACICTPRYRVSAGVLDDGLDEVLMPLPQNAPSPPPCALVWPGHPSASFQISIYNSGFLFKAAFCLAAIRGGDYSGCSKKSGGLDVGGKRTLLLSGFSTSVNIVNASQWVPSLVSSPLQYTIMLIL